MSCIRPPAVAERFYPGDPQQLRTLVHTCAGTSSGQAMALGALIPHAGLVYSGACAGAVFARITIPELVVILAPNHTGRADPEGRASIWPAGEFRTPLGAVAVDERFATRLSERSTAATLERGAHRDEHAIEVELPFLQVLAPATRIVPVVIPWDDWETSRQFATDLSSLVEDTDQPVLTLASSDMTHFEAAARARTQDNLALDAVMTVNGEALLAICRRERISMCGRVPAAVMLESARQLGATRGEVVDYRHSGLVTGDHDSVVAYAGAIIT